MRPAPSHKVRPIAALIGELGLGDRRSPSSATARSCRAQNMRRRCSPPATASSSSPSSEEVDVLKTSGNSANGTFRSRIIVGTGKYASLDETRAAIAASGAEIVTVALRRVDLDESKEPTVLDAIDRTKYVLLPNTAGCYTADEAIRTLHLARELGMDELVKLEVIGDPKTLFPDNTATVEAAQRLVKEGFKVLPYCSDDLITCKRLAGRRLPRGDAARRADRLGARHPQPAQHPPHHRERRRAGHRRRRRRHRVATRRSRWSSAAPPCS